MSRSAAAAAACATLLTAGVAHAQLAGTADLAHTGDASFGVDAGYTATFMPLFGLAQTGDLAKVRIDPDGAFHGVDAAAWLVLPHAIAGVDVGASFGRAPVSAVAWFGTDPASAWSGGALPDVDVRQLRAEGLVGGRIPLGYLAATGGLGLELALWRATPVGGSGAKTDGISEASVAAPIWARLELKPVCGLVLAGGASMHFGFAGTSFLAASFTTSVGFQSCSGPPRARSSDDADSEAIQVVSEDPLSRTGPFQVRRVLVDSPPVVVIENASDELLTVELAGDATRKLIVAPHDTSRITVTAGDYVVRATATNVAPYAKPATLERSRVYTWSFKVREDVAPVAP